jgi:hypothetical protein
VTTPSDQGALGPTRARRLGSVLGQRSSLFLGIAWIGGAAFVATRLNQEWYPHDDGSFAQSAARVLEGQLPHREFAELYTGGMTFLNAGVFWLFGQNLIWLRLPMFALFIAFLPVYYAIARRFVHPPVACLVTLFAVAWSVPSYPAAVPSWYVLFFSTFGAFCVIRHFETNRLWWLFGAGLFGGLAIGFKIVGIWYVMAVVIALVVAAVGGKGHGRERSTTRTPSLLIAAATAVFAFAVVVRVFASRMGEAEIVNLMIPAAVVCCVPVVLAIRNGATPMRAQLRAMGTTIGIFVSGVAVPLGILAIPYLATQSIRDLVDGALVSPQSRLVYAYGPTPRPGLLLAAVPVVLAVVCRPFVSARLRRVIDVGVVTLLAVLLAAGENGASQEILWNTARSLAPFVVVVGAIAVTTRRGCNTDDPRTMAVLWLLLLAGLGSLTQFPFGAPIYFCYVAPLVGLAAVAAIQHVRAGRGLLPTALLVALAVFGFVSVDRTSVPDLGRGFERDRSTVILDDERASIRVSAADRATYQRIAALIRLHASGRFVFAGPDAPEVYFLSGFENPTRSLFDFLDASDSARGAALLSTLRERRVNVIAVNDQPEFSDPLEGPVVSRLDALYPVHERVGRFDIRWQR